MYVVENQKPVLLQFRGMDLPIQVCLPNEVLLYLDRYATRMQTPEGNVIYHQPVSTEKMPELKVGGTGMFGFA